MDDFASKIQDFADLKVARVMGFEEEGCQMHSEDKVGACATGTLTRSRNKVVQDPFQEGVALLTTMRNWAKAFSWGRRDQLHAACQLAGCPELGITLDNCGTRVDPTRQMLEPMIRMGMGMGMRLHRDQTPNDTACQVTNEQQQAAAEFEAVLETTNRLSKLVQHEYACSGGYKINLFDMIEDALDESLGGVRVLDIEQQKKGKPKVRVLRHKDELTPLGQICFTRAGDDARRRHAGHASKPTTRDLVASGCDLRLIGRPGNFSSERMAEIKSAVEMKYHQYELKYYASDSDDAETEVQGMVQYIDGIPVFTQAEIGRISFEEAWDNWNGYSRMIRWKSVFKEELAHAECEDDLDPIQDLLELDVLKKVYKDLVEDPKKRNNGRYGLMPLLALCYVGNNLASSYCERVNSCAKLIMSHDRTLLDDDELEMVCFLRMNRTFIYYMKHQYPDVCASWKDEQTALLNK